MTGLHLVFHYCGGKAGMIPRIWLPQSIVIVSRRLITDSRYGVWCAHVHISLTVYLVWSQIMVVVHDYSKLIDLLVTSGKERSLLTERRARI